VIWKAPRAVRVDRVAWSAPTLVVHDGVVLSADCAAPDAADHRKGEADRVSWTVTARPMRGDLSVGELIAFSAADGNELWRCPTAQGYNAPADVFVAGGLVWVSQAPGRNTTDFTAGRDLKTGVVKRRLETDAAFTQTHHHRCYRNKATDRFIVLGRTGVELIDLAGAKPVRHCWVRGACQYGVMPANGLLYAPPHACACYIQSKLSGFWALAPKESRIRSPEWSRVRNPESGAGAGERQERGPAYGQIGNRQSQIENPEDWSTYRHDAGRTGRSQSKVPAQLGCVWQAELGGRLTSPVVAQGKLLVASVDAHTVHALDAESGSVLWCSVAGGRVDSPPTIHQGLAIFGCADGFVYCLRLDDGSLVWRFRAAPLDRRIVAFGRLESVWPVTGSVLVQNSEVYCTAGRSSFLDGGMVLYRLDPVTGKLLGATRFDSRDPRTGEQPEAVIEDVELPGALPDVLVYDGAHIYLRDKVLDPAGAEQGTYHPHLYSSAGLLDDNWWHRTYWLWGERTWGRASGWHVIPSFRPSGRILVTDRSTVFGYGRKTVRGNNLDGYHLFRADKRVEPVDKTILNNNLALMKYQKPAKVTYHWSRQVPLVVRAMVLAGDVLVAAGPAMDPADAGVREPTFDANSPALLMSFRAEDGQDLSRLNLDVQPVFDGMAAACGRLFLSTVDGKVVCLGSPGK
jgi:outer membrane protein assembly factor BamB